MKVDRTELVKHCKIINRIKLSNKILENSVIQKIPVKKNDEVSDDSLGEIFCQFIELVVRDGKRKEIPESTVHYFNDTFGEEEGSDEEDDNSQDQEEEEFDEDFEDDEEDNEIVEEEIEEDEPEPEPKKKQTRKKAAEKTVVEDPPITKKRGRKRSSDTGDPKESFDKQSSPDIDEEPNLKPKATRKTVTEEVVEDAPRKVERGSFEERKSVSGTRATLAIYEAWVKMGRPPCTMKIARIIHQELRGDELDMPHLTVHTNLYRFTTTGKYHRLPKEHAFIDQKYGIVHEPVTEEVKPITKLRKGAPKGTPKKKKT